MDSTPSRPQANKDQGSADVKALEEALSRLVREDTASASERRAQLAWQSYGETAKQKLAIFAPQLGWVLSLAGLKSLPAELIAEQPSAAAVQESEPDLSASCSALAAYHPEADAPRHKPAGVCFRHDWGCLKRSTMSTAPRWSCSRAGRFPPAPWRLLRAPMRLQKPPAIPRPTVAAIRATAIQSTNSTTKARARVMGRSPTHVPGALSPAEFKTSERVLRIAVLTFVANTANSRRCSLIFCPFPRNSVASWSASFIRSAATSTAA
jgi:hypothetical protein